MTIKYERLYGVPATANFVLFETDGIDVSVTASCVLGDIVIYIDEAAGANTTNLFSARAAHSGFGHRIVFTSAEMTGKRITAAVIDQDSTKEWLDEIIIIETYGNEKSLHNRRESGVILETTITSVSGNAEFIVDSKPNDNNTLLNSVALIFDDSGGATPVDRSFRNVIAYTGATGTVEIASDADFTMAAGDRVIFLPSADIESATAIASAVWAAIRTAHNAAGSFGEGVIINEYTASGSAEFSELTKGALGIFEAVTLDDLPANFASMSIGGTGGGVTVSANFDKANYSLSSAAYASAAKVALKLDWNSVSGEAARSSINALRFLRNKWSISGTTLTVTTEDDAATAWTSTLTTVASANTVTESDPA